MNGVLRLVVSHAMYSLTLASCASGRNPILVVPDPPARPLTLAGVLLSEERVEPLVGAQVVLHRLSAQGSTSPFREMRTPAAGTFQFDSLPAGRYLLDSRAIGFKRRRDTLLLGPAPALHLRVLMVEERMCLDMCPADPRILAAARAQRDRWACDRESASIEMARNGWVEFFSRRAQEDQVGPLLHSAAVAKGLRRIKDDRLCRRVAQAHGEATSLAFTVFRPGKFWLISEPNFDDPWVLDEEFKGVAYAGFLP